jgi:hypothetical protein
LSNRFKIIEIDKCVLYKIKHKDHIIVYLYMDDMLILGRIECIIKSIKKMLFIKFDMKDLGVANIKH